jgi:Nuclease-related domain
MSHSHAHRLACSSAARAAGRRWRSYLALLAVTLSAVAIIATVPHIPLRQGYTGIVLGAIAMLVSISLVGLQNPAVDGRFAEQWSLDGLRKVRGWHVTDNVPFEREDVDHVVVAPSAVLAVETKYHSRAYPGTPAETERHQRDLNSADRAAHKIRLLLRAEKLRDAADVVPVLIVWGPGAPRLPDGHRLENGVRLVDGDHPELWMHLFNAPLLAPDTRRDLHARFQKFGAKRSRHDAQVLPSLRGEMWREFRGGIAHERSQRADRHHRARELRRRHGGSKVAAPASPLAP